MGTVSLYCLFVLSAVGTNPIQDIPRDRVDLIEVNHFYDDQGQLVFDQVIYYDWSPQKERHQVVAWRLLKTPAQRPRHDFQTGEYVATWHDGETLREVRARVARESWTQFDPELTEREYLPKEKRKDLAKLHPPGGRKRKPTTPVPTPSAEVAQN